VGKSNELPKSPREDGLGFFHFFRIYIFYIVAFFGFQLFLFTRADSAPGAGQAGFVGPRAGGRTPFAHAMPPTEAPLALCGMPAGPSGCDPPEYYAAWPCAASRHGSNADSKHESDAARSCTSAWVHHRSKCSVRTLGKSSTCGKKGPSAADFSLGDAASTPNRPLVPAR